MSLRRIARVVDAAGSAGVPVLLWGEPGLGKSAFIDSLAAARQAHVEVLVGSTTDPADVNGLPVVDGDGNVSFAPRAFVHRLNAAEAAYLFLDELSTAPPASQAGMLRVARERWVGEARLGDHVRIVAAANPIEHAADGWELAAPMANRFLHLPFRPDAEDWFAGMTAGWETLLPPLTAADLIEDDPARALRARSLIVGFLRAKPALLQAVPTDPSLAGKAWPSRRTWDYLASVLAHLPETDDEEGFATRQMAAAGLVGDAAAVELLTFLRSIDLPDPEEVLADPHGQEWAAMRSDRLYTVLGSTTSLALAAGQRSEPQALWTAALEVLGAVADAGRGDVAAAFVRPLMEARPDDTRPPATLLRSLMPMLTAAGWREAAS